MSFDFEQVIGFWVNRASFLLRRELAQRFAREGHRVTPEEWALLMMLWWRDPQTSAELTERTIRDRTTVTRLLDGLVRKGLVRRGADARDRRRVVVSLTRHGRDLEAALVPVAVGLMADASRGIDAGRVSAAIATLRQLCLNLTALERGAPSTNGGGNGDR
jgi:DNA-binding MarR family transcriptional regulator